MHFRVFVLLSFLTVLSLPAQQGDTPGEKQAPIVPPHQIPPAPVLSTEQALKSFKLAPGFKIELVAASADAPKDKDPRFHPPSVN